MNKKQRNHKITFWTGLFLVFVFFIYPPRAGVSQSTIKGDSTVLDQIKQAELQQKQLKDTIRSGVYFVKENLPESKKATKSKTKVVYKTKIKRVPVYKVVIKHDTAYLPVSKSELFKTSQRYNDSLTRQKHIADSLAKERAYELKHRSIWKKIFGSKPKN